MKTEKNIADVRPGDRTGDTPGNIEFLGRVRVHDNPDARVFWRIRVIGDGALEDRSWDRTATLPVISDGTNLASNKEDA